VATVAISRWENELTVETLNANLRHPFHIEPLESEETSRKPACKASRSDVPAPDATLDAVGARAK
jgi:hypothetical protein